VVLAWWGAWAVLAIACLWRVASNLDFMDSMLLSSAWPVRIRRVMSLTGDGTVPGGLLLLICCSEQWSAPARRVTQGILALAGLLACAALAPFTVQQLAHREFTAAYAGTLAPLRAAIPPGTDVLWDGPAVATWVLLDRPNYLVPADTAGMVYSRAAALEMRRRAQVLSVAVPPQAFLQFDAPLELQLSAAQLRRICLTGEVPFIVSFKDIGQAPLLAVAPAAAGTAGAGATLRLYRCEREVALVQRIDTRVQRREVGAVVEHVVGQREARRAARLRREHRAGFVGGAAIARLQPRELQLLGRIDNQDPVDA
jgi:hypothetical protein